MQFGNPERISGKLSENERTLAEENRLLEIELDARKRDSLEDGLAVWDGEITKGENKMLQEENERLQGQVIIDKLTGAANLLGFTNRLEQFMGLARRENISSSLVYLDVDHFKRVNDNFGHAAGDAVLKDVCAFLIRSVREVDVVARIGGEEFAILFEGTEVEQAREKVEKIREGIHALTFETYPDLDRKVTASFGIASLTGGETSEDVRAHADSALYEAKHSGRNNVKAYKPK